MYSILLFSGLIRSFFLFFLNINLSLFIYRKRKVISIPGYCVPYPFASCLRSKYPHCWRNILGNLFPISFCNNLFPKTTTTVLSLNYFIRTTTHQKEKENKMHKKRIAIVTAVGVLILSAVLVVVLISVLTNAFNNVSNVQP